MRHAQRLATLAVILAAASAAAYGIARVWRAQSASISFEDVHWAYAALSLALLTSFVLVYAFCWTMLARALAGGDVRREAALRLFLLTWPGKYAPGGVLSYGGRLAGAGRIGLGRGPAAASFVYENAFAVAASGGTALVLILIHAHTRLGGGLSMTVAIAAAGVAAVCLHPRVPRIIIRCAARRVRRLSPLEEYVLPGGDALLIGGGYVVAALLVGLAFWSALRAFGAETSPLTAIAAYNLAGVAGMLAVFVPGGVGVREGAAVALLSGIVSPGTALSAAILARLASILADVLPLVALLLFASAKGALRWRDSRPLWLRGDAR